VDICVKHHQLDEVINLVSLSPPTTQFILDHLGKPNIAKSEIDPWRTNIMKLAAFPNVWCKLSGMVTEADLKDWKPEQLSPYIKHVIDCFGATRVMFGSDWPVCLLGVTHVKWVETLLPIVAQLVSKCDLQNLFSENAKKFYLKTS